MTTPSTLQVAGADASTEPALPQAAAVQGPPAVAAPATAPIRRTMACIAGFYRQQHEASSTLRQLEQVAQLAPGQCVVLGPQDATPRHFERSARQWAGPWQASGAPPRTAVWRWLGMALLLVPLPAALWWSLDESGLDEVYWAVSTVAVLLGAGLLAFGGSGWRKPRRPGRFDRHVLRQLTGGAWAVVVHGVPFERQPVVVDLLRQGGVGWCGEPAPKRRL